MNIDPEKCPLSQRSMAIDQLPSICLRQCAELWEQAMVDNDNIGDYDEYKSLFEDNNGCDHVGTNLEFSHEGLQKGAPLPTSKRAYSIVDLCLGTHEISCGAEFGEQQYYFHCPYDEIS